MSDRIQLNVRLDKHADLYLAAKDRAEEEGISLNDLVIRAIQQTLGWPVKHTSPVVRRSELEETLAPMQQRLEELERQLGEFTAWGLEKPSGKMN